MMFIFANKQYNAFTERSMYTLLDIHKEILNETFNYNSTLQNLQFNDICTEIDSDGTCSVSCVLEYFDFNETIINQTFATHEYLIGLNASNSSHASCYDDSDDDRDSDSETGIESGGNDVNFNLTLTNTSNTSNCEEINYNHIVTCPAAYSKITEALEILFERIGDPFECVNVSNGDFSDYLDNTSYADDYDEYEDDYSAENEDENELFETGILDFTPAFLCQYQTDNIAVIRHTNGRYNRIELKKYEGTKE